MFSAIRGRDFIFAVPVKWRMEGVVKNVVKKNQIIITALAIMIVVAGYLNFTGQEISPSGLVSSQKNENVIADATATPKETAKMKKRQQKTQDSANASSKSNKKQVSKTKKGTQDAKETTTDISAEDEGKDDYIVTDSGEVVASEENPGEAVMVSNSIGNDYFSSAKLAREQSRAKNKETLMEIINNKSLDAKEKKTAVNQVAAITDAAEKENAAELMLEAKGFEDAVVSITDDSADIVINAGELTSQQIAQVQDIVKRKAGIAADKIVITPVKVKSEK